MFLGGSLGLPCGVPCGVVARAVSVLSKCGGAQKQRERGKTELPQRRPPLIPRTNWRIHAMDLPLSFPKQSIIIIGVCPNPPHQSLGEGRV